MSCCGNACKCPKKTLGTCCKMLNSNELSNEELEFLKILEEVLYLPVGCIEEKPVFEEQYNENFTEIALKLQSKGIINIDFEEKLSNFDYEKNFNNISEVGSISLSNNYLNKIDFSFEAKNLGV